MGHVVQHGGRRVQGDDPLKQSEVMRSCGHGHWAVQRVKEPAAHSALPALANLRRHPKEGNNSLKSTGQPQVGPLCRHGLHQPPRLINC